MNDVMALQVSAVGAAQSSGGPRLPGALHAANGPGKSSGFAEKLGQKLSDLSGNDDLLTQIAGLLQSGMPLTAIVGRLATQLSDALARAAGENGDSNARSTLQRALTSALAPPGTSPPATSKEVAAALEQRLKNLLTTLTSKTATAGQQSEFSGNILDAESAKETPAQQKTPTSADPSANDVSLAAQALLQNALASLTAGSVQAGTASISAKAAPPAPTGTPGVSDILTRILTRAANADAQRTGSPAVSSTGSNGTTVSPSALFERLVAIIAEQSGSHDGKPSSGNLASDQGAMLPTATSHQASANLPAGPAFATQVASAAAPAAPAQTAVPLYTAVDPQEVIEQLVKGISMRTTGATSEVRMRLQPDQLGDVSLKLTVTGNTITANVIAQNVHVRDLLLQNQQQLARSLSDAGLSLGNFSVDVSGGNAGFTGQQAQHQHAQIKGAFGIALAGEDEQWTDPRFGPPLVPAGKSLVLNYLV